MSMKIVEEERRPSPAPKHNKIKLRKQKHDFKDQKPKLTENEAL